MSAGARVLVDTNVLVYGHDLDAGFKHELAVDLLHVLAVSRAGAFSAQVLGEFYSVVTRKYAHLLSRQRAADVVRDLVVSWRVLPTSSEVVVEALRGVERHGFSYYDAQIWAAARVAQIEVVLSEDFSDGATYDGVRFADPFAPGFDVEPLLA